MKQLTVDAKIENLEMLTDFIRDELIRHQCPKATITQISVVTDEIFTNISEYAYTPDSGSAYVGVDVDDKARTITLSFRDSGSRFNPLQMEEPDITLPASERPIGGLGIFMVKKMMSSVSYDYVDGFNVLTAKKSY